MKILSKVCCQPGKKLIWDGRNEAKKVIADIRLGNSCRTKAAPHDQLEPFSKSRCCNAISFYQIAIKSTINHIHKRLRSLWRSPHSISMIVSFRRCGQLTCNPLTTVPIPMTAIYFRWKEYQRTPLPFQRIIPPFDSSHIAASCHFGHTFAENAAVMCIPFVCLRGDSTLPISQLCHLCAVLKSRRRISEHRGCQ